MATMSTSLAPAAASAAPARRTLPPPLPAPALRAEAARPKVSGVIESASLDFGPGPLKRPAETAQAWLWVVEDFCEKQPNDDLLKR